MLRFSGTKATQFIGLLGKNQVTRSNIIFKNQFIFAPQFIRFSSSSSGTPDPITNFPQEPLSVNNQNGQSHHDVASTPEPVFPINPEPVSPINPEPASPINPEPASPIAQTITTTQQEPNIVTAVVEPSVIVSPESPVAQQATETVLQHALPLDPIAIQNLTGEAAVEALRLLREKSLVGKPWFVPNIDMSVGEGFLKSIGTFSSDFITMVHNTTGLPWWLAILCSTIFIRTCFLPFTVLQQRMSMRLFNLTPKINSIKAQLNNPYLSPDQASELRMSALTVQSDNGIKQSHLFLPLLIQMPLFLSFFFGIRMLAVHNPSLLTGGFGIFTDLCTCDQYYILPVVSAMTAALSFEITTRGKYSLPQHPIAKVAIRSIAIFTVPLLASFPKGVFIFWVTNNLFTAFQTALFQSAYIRNLFNIPPPDPEAVKEREKSLNKSKNSQTNPSFLQQLKNTVQQARNDAKIIQEQRSNSKSSPVVIPPIRDAKKFDITQNNNNNSNNNNENQIKNNPTAEAKIFVMEKDKKVVKNIVTYAHPPKQNKPKQNKK